jgi:hypothetical protein
VDRVPGVLTFDDLRAVSRLGPRATLATVERWARSCGIRYKYDGRGGIWTTLDAMNQALGIVPAEADGPYSPDSIV